MLHLLLALPPQLLILPSQKVREIEVLHATKDAKSSALLVYASDAAVSYETEPLPPQLRVREI